MPYIEKIIGPPGTGKTSYLIGRVAEELKAGINPRQIIYTSFTKAAAQEAKERAISQFQSEYNPDDFTNFSTIHSICFRLLDLGKDNVFAGRKLGEFCKYFGYEISSDNEDTEINSENELHERMLRTDADYFEHFLNWQRNAMTDINTAYKVFTEHNDVPDGFNMDLLQLYIERRNEYKRDNQLMDFGDMLEHVVVQGLCPDDVKVILSDEQQDVTPLLVRVLDTWSQNVERQYIAGDSYQCLYQWMAADPSIFDNAKADKTMVLKQSYRCPIQVHDLSRLVVERFNSRYDNDDYTPKQEQGHIIRTAPGAIDWNNLGNKVFYVHRTRWLLNQCMSELMLDGIPFATLRGIKSPLQTEKAHVVYALLRMVDNKTVPISDIVKVMDYLPTKTTGGDYLIQGAKAGAKRLMQEKAIRAISMRELHSLGFTDNFFRYFTREDILEPFKMDVQEKAYFNKLVEVHGVSVLDQEPKVILSTIHGVKGKECDSIVINLNLTRKTYKALLDSPDQEHRLFYVGVTRSRDNVVLLDVDDFQSYRL